MRKGDYIVLHKYMKLSRPLLVLTLLVVICMIVNGCSRKAYEEKVHRVGIISGAEAFVTIADGFKAKMAALGYLEGENIVYDMQQLNADPEGEKRAAEKFVEDKVDLIFAFPTGPALAAKAATHGTDIPVVFALAGIEDNNLVQSVASPGGNITGVRFPGPELTVKRLEILHELVPQARRILLLYDPDYSTIPTALSELRPAASSLDLMLVEEPVKDVGHIQTALRRRVRSASIDIDAILMMPEILTQSPDGWKIISGFAKEHKIPIGGALDFEVDLGALFSFVPDNVEMGTMAASSADKILQGTPAGTIMVVTPPGHLRLNYRTIQELGLTVREGLLSIAEEVIR
jgi:putative ABC transport system substrate-binding protein